MEKENEKKQKEELKRYENKIPDRESAENKLIEINGKIEKKEETLKQTEKMMKAQKNELQRLEDEKKEIESENERLSEQLIKLKKEEQNLNDIYTQNAKSLDTILSEWREKKQFVDGLKAEYQALDHMIFSNNNNIKNIEDGIIKIEECLEKSQKERYEIDQQFVNRQSLIKEQYKKIAEKWILQKNEANKKLDQLKKKHLEIQQNKAAKVQELKGLKEESLNLKERVKSMKSSKFGHDQLVIIYILFPFFHFL